MNNIIIYLIFIMSASCASYNIFGVDNNFKQTTDAEYCENGNNCYQYMKYISSKNNTYYLSWLGNSPGCDPFDKQSSRYKFNNITGFITDIDTYKLDGTDFVCNNLYDCSLKWCESMIRVGKPPALRIITESLPSTASICGSAIYL